MKNFYQPQSTVNCGNKVTKWDTKDEDRPTAKLTETKDINEFILKICFIVYYCVFFSIEYNLVTNKERLLTVNTPLKGNICIIKFKRKKY